MTISRRGLLGGAMIGLVPCELLAHGFHASFSVIEFNPRTNALELFHRIFTQDIEILLTARAGQAVSLENSARMEKLVEGYLLDVFSIKAADGRPLKPNWVGMKIQVDTLFVYQEIKAMAEVKGLVINSQILTETHPGQVNSVNITMNGRTQTLIFMANDAAQSVSF
jgi:hypothetical protein